MPSEGFLQAFHDLAEADATLRCNAAMMVRQSLATGATDDGKAAVEEDLQYALRRLVRGVQSSRQCCRQGFSLALSELLIEHPSELSDVLQMVRQYTLLQSGLRPAEQKERLLGRLFAYSAILESGAMHGIAASSSSKKKQAAGGKETLARDLGSGLKEIFESRQYLKSPAVHLQVQLCRELFAAKQLTLVADACEAWSLDEKVGDAASKDGEPLCVHAAGLALELRLLYEEAEAAGLDKKALQVWPACVRKDCFAKAPALKRLAAGLGAELVSALVSDALPSAVGSFCRWLFRRARVKEAEPLLLAVWPTLDTALFPQNAGAAVQAQGLRGLGEIAAFMQKAGAESSCAASEKLLVSFVESMQGGLQLLFQMLSWQRAHTHAAAVFAQSRLAEAIGAPAQVPPGVGPQGKAKQKSAALASDKTAVWQLSDDTRLAILASLQRHQGFGTMKSAYQRQWQQALVMPLSPKGIHARCAALFTSLLSNATGAKEAGTGDDMVAGGPASARICAEQLVQLVTHGHAPDEVILAVLCLLLTVSYFELPVSESSNCGTYSLRAFRESVGLSVLGGKEDLLVPVLAASFGASPSQATNEDGATEEQAASKGADDAAQWRAKLWSALTGLVRRTAPEMAEKHAEKVGDAPVSAEGNPVLHTLAFHGCLSDGSLWLMRLHEWWDYIMETPPSLPGNTSPKMTPKKKKQRFGAGSLKLAIELSVDDAALRKRALALCRSVLAAPGEGAALPARQRNALCGLPLALSLQLLQAEDEEDREPLRESLQDVLQALDKFVTLDGDGSQKKKALQARNDALAVVPRIACELFVESAGLVKEATKTAWRELGEYTSEETLTGLCASVCDEPDDGPGEEEENEAAGGRKKNGIDDESAEDDEDDEDDDDDEEDGGDENISAATAAKIAQFKAATEKVKAQNEAGEGDEIVLGSEEVWGQLLEDGDDTGGSLLTAFANSGLEGDDATGPKVTARQKRLRRQQEELARKLRELDLLEVFVNRFVEKRPVAVKVLQQLFQALITCSKRAAGGRSDVAKEGEKASKADGELRRLEGDLARRLSEMLSKALKQICRWQVVREVCQWHTAEDWAANAREFFAMAQDPKVAAAGPRPADVGAVLVYWLCSVHRAKSLGASSSTEADATKATQGWQLAEDLLATALKDWAGKKDSARWSEAVLGVFANRAPAVLLKLPWLEQMRGTSKPFIQRSQATFVSTRVLRTLSTCESGGATSSTSTAVGKLTAGFAQFCGEVLEGTMEAEGKAKKKKGDKADGKVAADSDTASASQRQKLRRDVLKALSTALGQQSKKHRHQQRQGQSPGSLPLDVKSARNIIAIMRRLIDSLPARRGEVYQLCLHIQRCLRPMIPADGNTSDASADTMAERQKQQQNKKKRKQSDHARTNSEDLGSEGMEADGADCCSSAASGGEEGSALKMRKRKRSESGMSAGKAAKATKGGKKAGFFGDL
eukprot:TRINITY_DN1137_c0_g1_i1.p1 TRINITY_DN1137_c0_g1~~TRINITY_DN1137_c0_g1_i1.p1  ORF type:complete len:1464 (+),score=399.56 TRINITY_DN1137_c0_g1_i1:243-4634(+)